MGFSSISRLQHVLKAAPLRGPTTPPARRRGPTRPWPPTIGPTTPPQLPPTTMPHMGAPHTVLDHPRGGQLTLRSTGPGGREWSPKPGRTGHVRRSRSGPKYRDLKPRERGRHQQVTRFPWDIVPMIWLTWDRQRRRVRWSTCRGCASGPCQVRGMLYKKPVPQRPRTWPGNGRRG